MPRWNTISISGYHILEAGCGGAGWLLRNGIEYVKACVRAGRMWMLCRTAQLLFNAHNSFLEEVAKFRAARHDSGQKLCASVFGAQDDRSWRLRFHADRRQHVNRPAAGQQHCAPSPCKRCAVLGGAPSLHTNGKDEALALPTEKSVEIALRTQQIIAHESGVADTVDPLGGSYYIEWLTDQIEAQATDYIARIDKMGGALRAVEEGFIQREIQDAAYQTQRQIESGEQVVVGVNRFQTAEEPVADLLRVDESVRTEQMAQLKQLRAKRENDCVQRILAQIETAARQPDAPLMPLIVEAVEAYATLGEICDALRGVFGEYAPESWV
ncbi:MAG: methylmalonyl-CoA mutase family protein [Caldilineaceae bacterium]